LMVAGPAGQDRPHANRRSPPCGATTTPAAPGPSAAGRRVVRHRRPPGRGGSPAWRLPPERASLVPARWRAAGPDALRSQGPTGPAPRLSDSQLRQVEQALLKGAGANGFVGELWTLDRIATVIERLTGVRHHPAWVWALLRHRLGWSVQRPVRRAAERDQDAIDRWVKERWPRILQTPNDAEPAWSSSTRPRSA
jgi:transposase